MKTMHTSGVINIVIGIDTREIWPNWYAVIGEETIHATSEATNELLSICRRMLPGVVMVFAFHENNLLWTTLERSMSDPTTPKLS